MCLYFVWTINGNYSQCYFNLVFEPIKFKDDHDRMLKFTQDKQADLFSIF